MMGGFDLPQFAELIRFLGDGREKCRTATPPNAKSDMSTVTGNDVVVPQLPQLRLVTANGNFAGPRKTHSSPPGTAGVLPNS
jgi:hypothetical protein